MRDQDLEDLEAFFFSNGPWPHLTSLNFTVPESEIFLKLPAAINTKHGQTCSVLKYDLHWLVLYGCVQILYSQ